MKAALLAILLALTRCELPLDMSEEAKAAIDTDCANHGGVKHRSLDDDNIIRATCNDGYQLVRIN